MPLRSHRRRIWRQQLDCWTDRRGPPLARGAAKHGLGRSRYRCGVAAVGLRLTRSLCKDRSQHVVSLSERFPAKKGFGVVNKATAKKIYDHLQVRRDEMVQLTAQCATMESPSAVPSSQAPVFDLFTRQLGELGFRCKRLAGQTSGGQLLADPTRLQETFAAATFAGAL